MSLPAGPAGRMRSVVGRAGRRLTGFDLLMRRFEQWCRHHFWVVVVILLATAVANELLLFGPDPTEWDVLFVTSVLVLIVGLWFGLVLPEQVPRTLEALHDRGTLQGSPAALSDAVLRRGDRWAHEGGLALAAAVAAAFVVAFRTDVVSRIWFTFVAAVAGYFVGRLISRIVAIGSLGSMVSARSEWQLHPNPFHHDGAAGLKPIGELYFRQASVLLIPGAFLAAWWILIPIVGSLNRYEHWRAPYLGLLGVTIVLQLLAFGLPMVSFHNLMRATKVEALAAADRRVSRQLAGIDAALAFTEDPAERANLRERSALLRDHHAAVEAMPTWPVDVTIRRRFTINNLLLLVPFIGRAIGLSDSWSDLSDRLRDVFGSGG